MSLYHRKVQLLLVLLALYAVNSTAVDLSQCFADVIGCANNTNGQACAALNISNATALSLLRTSKGTSVVTPDDATALSYPACNKYCGTGLGPFSWSVFSQQYAAWLLPYLALLSQLPFGAKRRTDNLMSVILTLGSPTLAGYSLYITALNARWVNDHLFSGIDYPSVAVRQSVVRVLNNLQHVPLRVYPGNSALFESLVVLAKNDAWWNTFAAELDYSQTWSIASATSIAWVVIAFLLTVADSLSNVAANFNSSGQGTGSVWLWLLPIVMGWLVISPKCDYDRVFKAYRKANKHVVVANPGKSAEPTTRVTTKFGLTISPTPDWELHRKNITSPDESRTPPVFSYARTLYWSQSVYVTSLFYRAAWRRSKDGVGVDGRPIPETTDHHDHDAIPEESRQGTREQVIHYCKPDSHEYPGGHVLWPRGVLTNMIVASIMSLQLQWGTTLGAVIAVWFTPTIGLGCRTLAYLIYGMLSTLVWILLLLSSVLGYYAHNLANSLSVSDMENDKQQEDIPPDANKPATISARALVIARVADWLRWIGKTVAIVNAIGIITSSLFQLAGVYNTCYCDSSVYTWGADAFAVFAPNQSDVDLAKNGWIGALGLGLTSCTIFVGTLYLVWDSVPS